MYQAIIGCYLYGVLVPFFRHLNTLDIQSPMLTQHCYLLLNISLPPKPDLAASQSHDIEHASTQFLTGVSYNIIESII